MNYHYRFIRIEYPCFCKYRMETVSLPDWIHIEIIKEGDSKRAIVHSRIHMNKSAPVGPSYSTEFTDQEILKDVSAEVYRRWIQ